MSSGPPPPPPACPNPAPAPAPAPAAAPPPNNTGLIITGVVAGLVILIVGYFYLFRGEGSFLSKLPTFLLYAVILGLLIFGIYFFVFGLQGGGVSSGNLAPSPVDSATGSTISSSVIPAAGGVNGGNYGLQWWMYIKDWNYRFGEEKAVLSRGTDGTFNPYVYLHPTENSLCVKINVFSGAGGAGQSSSPAPVGGDGSQTDDSFTCTVRNVPLQSWFCVNVSVDGRNVDIYLNGLLVRSCLLPGVPKTPTGDLRLMPGGGFSGNVIDVYHQSRALKPADAKDFCAKGTSGQNYSELPSRSLFGYNVKFSVNDSNTGKEIKQYTL